MIRRIVLIRHGETLDNARGVAQGWSDSALSPLGEWQVARLGAATARLGITRLYSSPLPRAMTTAQAIAGATGLRIEQLHDFREMHCGDWEGQEFDLVRRSDPDFHHKWSSDPEVACPGGESYADVRARLKNGFATLRDHFANDGDNAVVAVVSHGTAIRIAATELLGLPLEFARNFAQDNTAINIFEWRHERYVLKLWNDTTHCASPS